MEAIVKTVVDLDDVGGVLTEEWKTNYEKSTPPKGLREATGDI